MTILLTILAALIAPADFVKSYAEDPTVALGNHQPYVYVKQKDSRAPWGYRPFYLSHYGRHGARSGFNCGYDEKALFPLRKAASLGLLTPDGEKMLACASASSAAYDQMAGRLTERGAREHREIAGRMYKRFSRVFKRGRVRAISSEVPRCILSMDNALQLLHRESPRLIISSDAGERIQRYASTSGSPEVRARVTYLRDSVRNADCPPCDAFMGKIFKDPAAAKDIVADPSTFRNALWETVGTAPAFDIPYKEALSLFSADEAWYFKQLSDIFIYLTQCNSLPFGESRMVRTALLANDIVDKADEAISLSSASRDERIAADLRFGHDYTLLAIMSYLGLEGVGERYDLEGMRNVWHCTDYAPFAGNLQMVFYKSRCSRKPVLVKFLMNERETSVPALKAFKGKYYKWDDVKSHIAGRLKVRLLGQLSGDGMKKNREGKWVYEAYQGMDIWGDYMLSCQNAGTAAVYRLDEDASGNAREDAFHKVGEFKLASAGKLNHSNVASFLPVFYDESDPLPLVGISRCHKELYNGLKDELYIERIAADFQSSSPVAVINYQDRNKDFGYALQWVVDRENRILYGYGNTVSNKGEGNNHRIIAFPLPDVKAHEGGIINLSAADAIENYLIEDTYPEMPDHIGQGLFVHDGRLFIPVGVGREKDPSYINVWNLAGRRMEKVVDLRQSTAGEFEDLSVRNGSIYIQSNNDGGGLLWKAPLAICM